MGLPRFHDGIDIESHDIGAAAGARVVVPGNDHAALGTPTEPPRIGDSLAEVQVYGPRGIDRARLAVGLHHILGHDAVAMAATANGLGVVRLVDMQPATDDPLVPQRDRLRCLLDYEVEAMALDLSQPCLGRRMPKADERVDADVAERGCTARLL